MVVEYTDRRLSYFKKLKTMVSPHFTIEEFVDKATFEAEGENSITFIDKNLISIAEFIRTDIGKPVTINNWHTGGQFKESGLRNPNTTTGAKKSTHKTGKAIDVKVKGMGGKEWYEYVVKNAKKLYELGLRRIEDKSLATTWCHMDTKEHGKKGVIQVVDLTDIVEEINATGL